MSREEERLLEEQTIVDYLLGDLPQSDVERFDELSITDDEFAGKLNAVEKDLVDSYVRGELSGDLLAKFESFYLSSPERRDKVAFAKTFVGVIDRAPLISTSHKSFSFAQWGFAAAAIVISLVAGYLIVENVRLRNQLSQTRAEYAVLQQRQRELQQQLTSNAGAAQELARVRQRLTELEKQLPSEEQPPEKVIAFNLSPPSRGLNQLPALTIPDQTGSVSIALELELNDFPEYKVALKSPVNGQILWQSDKLKPNYGNSIQIKLPANLLKSQNYVLELSGITEKGTIEFVSGYPFKALKQ